jgi:hypothetical protein
LLLFVSQLRDNDNIVALRDQESFSPSTPLPLEGIIDIPV